LKSKEKAIKPEKIIKLRKILGARNNKFNLIFLDSVSIKYNWKPFSGKEQSIHSNKVKKIPH
jgi:hypothetical protein